MTSWSGNIFRVHAERKRLDARVARPHQQILNRLVLHVLLALWEARREGIRPTDLSSALDVDVQLRQKLQHNVGCVQWK